MSETVTQLLDRYDDDLMELARLSTQGMFDKDLYASASEARQQIVDLVAAARREVETVTRERDEVLVAMEGIVEVYSPNANHSQHMLSRAEYCLKGKRDHIAAHVEGYRQELAYQKTENAALRADLATSRAQLAGVRERVEKLDRYDPIVDCNEPYMEHTERGDYFACADVLAALGGDA